MPDIVPSLSIVVPCYNSAESLPLLIARLIPLLNARNADYEIILVDDGSRDHTWMVTQTLAAQHSSVRGSPAAFITGTASGKRGQIGLLGVDERARGRGLGGLIVRAALDEFRQRGCIHVSVVTQGRNIGAQKVYQWAGFTSDSIRLWFHGWFGT